MLLRPERLGTERGPNDRRRRGVFGEGDVGEANQQYREDRKNTPWEGMGSRREEGRHDNGVE